MHYSEVPFKMVVVNTLVADVSMSNHQL